MDVAEPIWFWGWQPRKHKKCLLCLLLTLLEPDQCLSHQTILLIKGPISEIFKIFFWELAFWKSQFFFSKKNCFCFMKISPTLHGRLDGLKFWLFPWFPENSLLCVILCYTVYYTVFSHYEVRSQHAVPVVRQWLHRHQTGVKELSGSGQAIIRQWLGNQLGSQCTIVDSVSDIWPKILIVFGSNMNLIAPFICWKA